MTPDRFECLYERYCDGELAPAEREEFLAALGTPEGRARFVEFSTFAAVVADEVRYMVVPGPGSKPQAAARVSPRRARSRRSSPGSPLGLIFAVAAAVLVGIVVLIASVGGGAKPPAPAPKERPVVERRAPAVELPRPVERETPRPPPPSAAPDVERRDPEPFVPQPPRPPDPVKQPEPPPPVETPKPAPKPVEKETTVAVVAHVEAVSGKVSVPAGKGLRSGEGLETGADGYALVRLGDGTKVELGSATSIARVSERSVQLERGLIAVEAAKQAPGKPLVFATPHGEAAVLGTEFTLYVTPAFSRVDVREGRVKFTRLPGVSSVVVTAGQFAVTGQPELVARTGPGGWKAPAQNLLFWLRPDSLARGPVASWADSSGNGLHATQPVASAQPALVPNAWAGRPALRFDGADDHFELPAGFSDFRAGLSVFVVARIEAAPLWMRFLDLGKGPTCDNIFFGRKDAAQTLTLWVYANSVTRGKVDALEGVQPGAVHSYSSVMGSTGRVALYRNGAAVGTGTTSVPATVLRKPNYVGKSNYGGGDPTLKGDLFEMVLFNRAVSEQERAYIESYFALKYFDPTAPPALARP